MIIDLRKNGNMPAADFSVVPTQVPSSSVPKTFSGEVDLSIESPDTTTPNYSCSFAARSFDDVVVVANSNPAACSIENFPLIEYVGIGSSTITISLNGALSRTTTLLFAPTSNSQVVFLGYNNTTSVAAVLFNEVEARLDNAKDAEMFVGFDPTDLAPARNANCWLHDVDLSGNAYATTVNYSWTHANSGALLTPQHFVGVAHFSSPNNLAIGCQLRFLDSENVLHTRTVIGSARDTGYFPDCIVATLDTPLPATATPFKIAGNWMVDRVNPREIRVKAVGFFINQFKQVSVVAFDAVQGTYQINGQTAFIADITYDGVVYADKLSRISWPQKDQLAYTSGSSPFHDFEKFLKYAITGDSGCPLFVVVGGEPVLVSLFTGPNIGHFYHEDLEDLLNALIANADINANITTGTAVTPGGVGTLTVTVAADPTL